jgi:pimeloyl-ACP methyl ester carboxylesterase
MSISSRRAFAAGACLWVAAGVLACGHGQGGGPPRPASPATAGAALEGAWAGTLVIGPVRLRLVVKIRRQGSGWAATLDSVDQHAQDIPIDTVTFEGDALTLRASKLQASFDARLERDSLSGTFRQRGVVVALMLTKTAHPPTVSRRPQEPLRPFPYDELELVVDNPPGHGQLACTLTRPRGAGPFPAVLLVTGSGPQNRDESLAGHRPFLVLSDALTRRGIAVLRCDDRGIAQSTGDFATATTFDFVDDTLAELAALRARDGIDPQRVGLIGHSEGAMIAPMAAVRSSDVKFVVLLAAPALPGRQTISLQQAAIAKAAGASDAEINRTEAEQREIFAIVTKEKDEAAAAKLLRARFEALPEAERRAAERKPGFLDAQIKQVTSPWFRAFLELDPRDSLRRLAVPVLVLQGERDLQVLPSANLPELRRALHDNPDVTIQELPGLNHLFQSCRTGSPDEYARIDETLSPTVPSIVVDWIAHHAAAPHASFPR